MKTVKCFWIFILHIDVNKFHPNRHLFQETNLQFQFNKFVPPSGLQRGFPNDSVGKESACNAGDGRDTGSIPGSGKCPGVVNAICYSILAWKILWTEKLGRLVHGVQRIRQDWATKHSTRNLKWSICQNIFLNEWMNKH